MRTGQDQGETRVRIKLSSGENSEDQREPEGSGEDQVRINQN